MLFLLLSSADCATEKTVRPQEKKDTHMTRPSLISIQHPSIALALINRARGRARGDEDDAAAPDFAGSANAVQPEEANGAILLVACAHQGCSGWKFENESLKIACEPPASSAGAAAPQGQGKHSGRQHAQARARGKEPIATRLPSICSRCLVPPPARIPSPRVPLCTPISNFNRPRPFPAWNGLYRVSTTKTLHACLPANDSSPTFPPPPARSNRMAR